MNKNAYPRSSILNNYIEKDRCGRRTFLYLVAIISLKFQDTVSSSLFMSSSPNVIGYLVQITVQIRSMSYDQSVEAHPRIYFACSSGVVISVPS